MSDLPHSNVIDVIAPHDQMFDASKRTHYFGVGASNVRSLMTIMQIRADVVGQIPVRDILDFGSGCGRVARFIRAAFPDSRLWVTDLRQEDVEWCVSNLGCYSAVGDVGVRKYDLIWLGSVFTHLPKDSALQLMRRLYDGLNPFGVLAFSTHGRYCIGRIKSVDWSCGPDRSAVPYGLDRAAAEAVIAGYSNDSYGYVDSPNQVGYGVTVAPPEWYMNAMRNTADATQIFLQERGNDDHQDLFAFLRRPISAPWNAPTMGASPSAEAGRNFWGDGRGRP